MPNVQGADNTLRSAALGASAQRGGFQSVLHPKSIDLSQIRLGSAITCDRGRLAQSHLRAVSRLNVASGAIQVAVFAVEFVASTPVEKDDLTSEGLDDVDAQLWACRDLLLRDPAEGSE